ncbi:hypothetical protein WA158_000776 [Blastocystis sp. Blastoise]
MCSSTILPANQAIFFTLMSYRLAISGNKLATQFHIKLSKIHTALRRGIHSIGMCFNEFSSNFDVPKLNMKLDRIDLRILSSLPKVLNSTFVIDGRHQLFGNISNNGIIIKKLYSYKHKKTALNSQFIINHNGYCVYVSPGHPASSHDVIMYRTYRNVIINDLRNMIDDKYGEDNNSSNEELYILTDEGYVGGGDELLTSPGSNHFSISTSRTNNNSQNISSNQISINDSQINRNNNNSNSNSNSISSVSEIIIIIILKIFLQILLIKHSINIDY